MMTIKTLSSSQRKHAQRAAGFTLTELAIVLGVIGTVLTGIWISAATVYSNVKIERAYQDVTTIVQNIRQMYAGQPTLYSTVVGTDMTGNMVTANVYPADMFSTGAATAYSPWGSGVSTLVAKNINPGDSFEIDFTTPGSLAFATLPSDACVGLLSRIVAPGAVSGIVSVTADGATWQGSVNALDSTSFSTACTTTGKVGFRFKLRG